MNLRISPFDDGFVAARDAVESPKYPESAKRLFEHYLQVGETHEAERQRRYESNQRNDAEIAELTVNLRVLEEARIVPTETMSDAQFEKLKESHAQNIARTKARLEDRLAKRKAYFERPAQPSGALEDLRRELNYMDLCQFIVTRSPRRSFNAIYMQMGGRDAEKVLKAAIAKEEKLLARGLEDAKAAPSLEEALASMRAAVAKRARESRPNIAGVLRANRLGGLSGVDFPTDANLADWACAPQIEAALEEQIRAAFEGREQIPLTERKERRATLEAEWIENQREIVAACLALDKPVPVVHPLAALGIEYGELAYDDGSAYRGRDALPHELPTLTAGPSPSLEDQIGSVGRIAPAKIHKRRK